ncbi:hypothetical protein ACC703_38245, partial [Rhizobium ruizarguesonis]
TPARHSTDILIDDSDFAIGRIEFHQHLKHLLQAGVPTLALSANAFRGRKWEKSFEMAFAFKEELSYGKVYEYRLNTAEIKTPLIEAAHRAGAGEAW